MSGPEGGVTHHPVRDRVLGKIKETAGSLTGNGRWEEQGALQQERTVAAERAEESRQRAEEREEEAEIISRQAALRAEAERIETEETRAAERDHIAAEKREAEARAEVEKSVRAARIHAQTAAAYEQARAGESDAVKDRAAAEEQARRLDRVAESMESEATQGEAGQR